MSPSTTTRLPTRTCRSSSRRRRRTRWWRVLRRAELTVRRANDILRASGLTAAPLDDPGVVKDLIKVIEGKPLSPILVVGSAAGTDIADGFHRVSLA
jgi:hypothetical protein